MRAFKTWLAAAVVGLGSAGAAAAADPYRSGPVAQGGVKVLPYPYPNPGPVPPRVDYDYVVVYKASVFAPPRVHGRFETLHHARHAERRLESFGYPARIIPVRDFHHGWRW